MYQQTQQQGDLQTIFGGHAFDPQTIEPQGDFEVLPPCKPPAMIEKAEIKENSKGTGHYIKLELKVLDGPHKNRKLFDNINIDNPSNKCVEIGMRVLSALGRAIGATAITDTSQLLNQVVIPHVIVQNDAVYGQKNAIRTYSPPSEAQPQTGDAGLPAPTTAQPVAVPSAAGPAAASPVGPAAPGSAQAQTANRPWERKAA
jgi:hypothetical protein